jgi:ketosteroid isomerase-like protein
VARGGCVNKAVLVLLAGTLSMAPVLSSQEPQSEQMSCIQACTKERPNTELMRQEVVALEHETARAIQLNNATFFKRVYSDDFTGVLSGGQPVDKVLLIATVQKPEIQYESFSVSDIKVRLYRDIAVATCLWSVRGVSNGKKTTAQMRAMHVYFYTTSGYRVISSQTTLLPASAQQPL